MSSSVIKIPDHESVCLMNLDLEFDLSFRYDQPLKLKVEPHVLSDSCEFLLQDQIKTFRFRLRLKIELCHECGNNSGV